MLEIKNLSLTLGSSKVLDNVSFKVNKGTVLGLVGPSGVGKTSLIKAIVGIYEGDDGEILFNGERIYDNKNVKSKISYVPDEHNSFFLISVKEIIDFYKSSYHNFDEEKFHKINKILKIPINKRFLQLSKGMKARVNIMLALSMKNELLVLDEPTSGLDPILKEKVLKLIMREVYEEEKAVIISSHNLGELERICDEIMILNEGTVEYHNSLDKMKENIKKLQVAFDKSINKDDLNIEGVFSISQLGRVFTLVTDKYDEEFKNNLDKFTPLFIEEIDLSLEEVFIHKLEKEEERYEEIFK